MLARCSTTGNFMNRDPFPTSSVAGEQPGAMDGKYYPAKMHLPS